MVVNYKPSGEPIRGPKRATPKKRIRRDVTREVFERTTLVHVQALKFVPEYVEARQGLFKQFGGEAIRAAALDIAKRPKTSHGLVHQALRRLLARFALPIGVPPDPRDLQDLPPLPHGPLPWRHGSGAMKFGVRIVGSPLGAGSLATVARLDVDMERTLRELMEGVRMVRRGAGITTVVSPEQFGVHPLVPQPGLSSSHEPRIDVDLSRPDDQILAGLRIAQGQAQAAQKSERLLEVRSGKKPRGTRRTLRSRGWNGDDGYALAFELLKLSRDRACADPKRLTKMLDPEVWENSENLAIREQLVSRSKTLLRVAESAVRMAAVGVGLRDWIESSGEVGRPTEELEAEILAELHDTAPTAPSEPLGTKRTRKRRWS